MSNVNPRMFLFNSFICLLDWPRADIILVSLSHSDKISSYDNILLGGYTDDKTQMVLIKVYGDSLEVASTSKV